MGYCLYSLLEPKIMVHSGASVNNPSLIPKIQPNRRKVAIAQQHEGDWMGALGGQTSWVVGRNTEKGVPGRPTMVLMKAPVCQP